jgi:hypothetical protein
MVADGVSIVSRRNQRKQTLPGTLSENIWGAQCLTAAAAGSRRMIVKADAARRSADGSAAALHSRQLTNLRSRCRSSFRAARKVRRRDGGSRPRG